MDMIRQIKMEYDFSDVKWLKKDQILDSEYGKKRIRIWKDKQLLQWHVKWRDEISNKSGILLDRMIRTKAGDPFFISEKGWTSIHDEIEEQFPCQGREQEWGRLIGSILAYGLAQSDDCQRFKKQDQLTLDADKASIDELPFLDPMAKLVLERSYYEAKNRTRKADHLLDRIHQKRLPILLPFSSLIDAKQVVFTLFWICGDAHPVKGYEPIRHLLEEWYLKNGAVSTELLLDKTNEYFSLKGDQGLLLLTECLLPYELKTVFRDLSINETVAGTSKIMKSYFQSWETSRKLVLLISNWIEKEGEKAVAR
ncbi:hypothetical protein RJD24_16000 [Bacillaceae bacterium IKA-2]|nr:hypothetical protein RJD24_16000 [Bacillaceae bacterium IKA-2]